MWLVAGIPRSSGVFVIVIIGRLRNRARGRDGTSVAERAAKRAKRRTEGESGCEPPGCSPIDSRTVVGGDGRVAPRARCVASRCCRTMRPVVHSFGHASSSLPPPLTLSLSVSRVSRDCPQIARNYWLLLFSRHTPHGSLARSLRRSMSFLPVPVTLSLRFHILVCRFSSFFSRPPLLAPFPAPATSVTMSFLLVFLREECPSSISFVTRCAYFSAFVSSFSQWNIVINPDIGRNGQVDERTETVSVETELARIAISRLRKITQVDTVFFLRHEQMTFLDA